MNSGIASLNSSFNRVTKQRFHMLYELIPECTNEKMMKSRILYTKTSPNKPLEGRRFMLPKRLARDVIYESDWINLYVDKIKYPNGSILEKHHVIHFDYESIGVVIQNEHNEVLLIKSNRYVTQMEEWEIPAGRVENEEMAYNAVIREALEETGYSIENPEFIYKYNPSNGISDQVVSIYKARASKKVCRHDPVEVSEIRWVSKKEVKNMIRSNKIRCGLSLTGLLLVLFVDL